MPLLTLSYWYHSRKQEYVPYTGKVLRNYRTICVIEKSWELRHSEGKTPERNECSTLWLFCSHNRSETRDWVIKSKAPPFSFLFLRLKALPLNSSILSRGIQPGLPGDKKGRWTSQDEVDPYHMYDIMWHASMKLCGKLSTNLPASPQS